MNKRRHWAATPALIIGIAIVGVAWTLSYGGLFGSSRESLPEESSGSTPPPGAIAVTVAPLTLRPIHRIVNCVGTLHAFEQVTVSAKVEGRVRKIAHDVGDRVKPGDLLLQIDPVDFNLSVRQAQSALDVELAKLGLTTPTATFDVNSLPSVVEAEAKLERMQERMERVRTLVERVRHVPRRVEQPDERLPLAQGRARQPGPPGEKRPGDDPDETRSPLHRPPAAQGRADRRAAAHVNSRRRPSADLRGDEPHGSRRLVPPRGPRFSSW